MSAKSDSVNPRALDIEKRANELFVAQDDAHKRRVGRVFAVLMGVQWIFGIVVAVFLSPYAWEGKTRVIHVHVPIAVIFGAILSSLPIALVLTQPSRPITRHVIAVAQILWAALLIHLTGGRVESHFHIFGSLAFLAFYRDWKVLIPATIVVAADHLLRQIFWPESVYGILTPESWRFAEHAFWVVFEDVFLVISCVAGAKEMRELARERAKAEMGQKLEQEMQIASRIQTSLLPRRMEVDGLTIAASMIPANEVGGDYYDVIRVADGAWIGIGDVAGHGLNAGLIMLQAQCAVEALVSENPNGAPRDVLNHVNRVLYENIRRRLQHDDHMTLSLIRYFDDGRLVVTGAHEEMLICRGATGRCETVPVQGTWIGAREDISRFNVEVTHNLDRGDIIVLYSDGVTEARNAKRELFGLDRLSAAVEEARTGTVEAIRDHVLDKVNAWTAVQDDDVTLMIIRYVGVAALAPGSRSLKAADSAA
jgi:serine phosphatase RsbU (regulator of sigma subunit)